MGGDLKPCLVCKTPFDWWYGGKCPGCGAAYEHIDAPTISPPEVEKLAADRVALRAKLVRVWELVERGAAAANEVQDALEEIARLIDE